MTHKAPRTAPDGRDGAGRGIAYLSIADAAQRVGVHRNTIEKWTRQHWTWESLACIVIDYEAALAVVGPRLPMGPEGRA